MIGHQVPLLDPAFLLRGQILEHFTQMLPQLPVQLLAPVLGDKDHMVLAIPLRVT
jgi:hypothetical protein